MNYWNEQTVDRAKSLHAERYSMSMIALAINETFGTTFTRNAVIGKLNRLGFRSGSITRGLKAPRIVQARKQRQAAPRPHIVQKVVFIPAPVVTPSSEHRVGFFGLGNQHCRYPLWGGDTAFAEKFYCGSPTANFLEGRCYCPFHQARMWRSGEAA